MTSDTYQFLILVDGLLQQAHVSTASGPSVASIRSLSI